MNVAVVCFPTHGGSGVVAAELGMEVARRGNRVHFVSYQMPFRLDPLQANVFYHEVRVSDYPLFRHPPYALELAARLVEVVRAESAHLLHVHYAIPHSISAILARQMCEECGIRVITTLHGTDITLVGAEPNFQEVVRFGIEKSDAVTAVSESLAAATRARFQVRQPIRVIPNFIDPTRYNPARRNPALRARFAKPEEKLLIHISNFRDVKRIPDVVSIFEKVARRIHARMLFVGNGPDLPLAKSMLEDLGRSAQATFVGPLSDVYDVLACSDLLLLPSLNESFGLSALEALASGVPVVGTKSGGIPEVVDDNVTGILEPVGAVDEMASRAVELLQDEPRLKRAREEARRAAESRFPMNKVVDQYLALYSEVLAAPRK